MTTEARSATRAIRTYGGWRRTRAMGLFGAGPGATDASRRETRLRTALHA